jgi:hypothetical protein
MLANVSRKHDACRERGQESAGLPNSVGPWGQAVRPSPCAMSEAHHLPARMHAQALLTVAKHCSLWLLHTKAHLAIWLVQAKSSACASI